MIKIIDEKISKFTSTDTENQNDKKKIGIMRESVKKLTKQMGKKTLLGWWLLKWLNKLVDLEQKPRQLQQGDKHKMNIQLSRKLTTN